MYDQNRLLRLPNTINSKSRRWKIPLQTQEIFCLSIDDITRLAAQGPRAVDFPNWGDTKPSPPLLALNQSFSTSPNGPKGNPQAPDSLFPVSMREGDGRDKAAFRIARYCRDHGTGRDVALQILSLWDAHQVDRLGEKVLEQKVASAFGRAGDGAQVEITADQIKTPFELAEEYRRYVDMLKSHKVVLGWPQIDDRLRGIAPGEVLTIIARSGVGKTAALQNILRHISLGQDGTTLFCSLEQPLAQVFERYAQMATEKSGEEIEKGYDDPQESERISNAVRRDLTDDRTLTCGVGGLKLHQLDQAIDAAEQKCGRPINLLAIDYLGLLDTSDLGKALYEQVSRAARELKNLAKRRDIVVISLCQVSRANGEDGSKPLNVYSARESGAIEESADFLLGLYRPELHGGDNTITVQILKNRKGQDGVEFSYRFEKRSLQINPPKPVIAKHAY